MKQFKWVLMFFLLIAGQQSRLNAQRVCGAEIRKVFYDAEDHELMVRIQVCRERFSKDFLVLQWGDGLIDSIPRVATLNEGPNHLVDYYTANHFYDESINQYIEITIMNEEIVSDLKNVNYSFGSAFSLTDSIYIYTEENAPIVPGGHFNQGPWANSLGIEAFEGTDVYVNLLMHQEQPIDSLEFYIGEFPVEGYSRPAPEDEFYMDRGIMIWDQPMVPGKYAVASKVRERTWVNNPIYDEEWLLFSTITRAFMLVVDSSNIVSTVGIPEIGLVSVYPNPVQGLLQIEYGGLTGTVQLQISNMQGQILHQKELISAAQLQNYQLDVSKWPVGMYAVEIKNEQGRVVKKVLVE